MKLIRIYKVAEEYGISTRQVYYLIDQGVLKKHSRGRMSWVETGQIEEYITGEAVG